MTATRRRGGNRIAVPARPFEVTKDELESAVRETFSQQVAVPRPLAVDPAGDAIRRARRVQRQRTMTGLALAAVATVVVSTGVAQLGAEPRRSAPPTVVLGDPYASARPNPVLSSEPAIVDGQAPGTEVDLIVGTVIVAADGRRVALAGVGPAERAHRLPENAGWLVVGAATTAGRSLWSVSREGNAQVLLAGAETIIVSADGRQVAWRDGADLVSAGVVGTQLIAPVRTPAPAAAVPEGFVGDAVLVRLDPARPGHTIWHPSVGPVSGDADRATLNLYGALPDGRLVGQISGARADGPCLAVVDPGRELAPVHTGCGTTLSQDGLGAVSGDGRWLLANGRFDGAESALLIDVTRIGGTVNARPAGPPMTGAVAWASPDAAAYVDGSGELVRVQVKSVLAGEPAAPAPVPGAGPTDRPVVVSGS
ncbi:hypothetical protein [Micromonospora sp. NPDC051006]|uniref:hypothetical protein n=1 Tax=Micromonospora sp. NPDC051006 TaxID=3364283 RepID=UPI0037B9E8DA